MKSLYRAIIAFVLLGLIKLPLETWATTHLRASGALQPPPSLKLRDNLGQMSFAAALGGLRSLVASITYLQGFGAFEEQDWAKVDTYNSLTTQLQPNYDVYWDDAGSRMGLDAASYYRYNESRERLYREQLYRKHVARGIQLLESGLQQLPKSKRLHARLGYFYASRLEPPDHQRAATHYLLAHKYGGLPMLERLAAYEMAKIDTDPAALRQAYTILRRAYDADYGKRIPSVITQLIKLQSLLKIPPWEQIPETLQLRAK
jgi:hypothetical protein